MEYLKEKLTRSQQNSLHKFLEMLAEELNQNGITLKSVTEVIPIAECPATKENLKELVWKPIQRSLYSKSSTTELLKQGEIDKIYDTICRMFGEMGVSIPPFPSSEAELKN